ncbi:Lrp/AsnC family transcriptional regulator [Pseudochrobactrum asaccharolyticum]|jgi:DNA-binding Lrp family transcriptional regulator|uniref:AsnC family transcriptional regulator n=1 Tax=Pseudochrobactrum asaccharolyticum TaxID=354351 RepID=A0A366DP54_9HYPH|nr:Lrp/AsnC family transcriptional regulator [Pseudochrobactrum asaccharolyticum]MBX8802594.1 Lrp/AsnC family transcriptional regulator [Ochrobactrum sp. MR28]MBX8818174.1 Lrp/AsnC family transcriptional regulator [Ochrobactrum sp. MR31]MDR2310143.1 Lrp/AsnC family transcriptional regulator [Brucellaceae bacterium]RBO91239.1 AsnC family transcriptional regulator [Pseudochrobactrum asaccharolyticum]
MKLDEVDKKILRVLQQDGRIANNDLAREVGLSPSPCLRRVKLLEEAGVIDRYVAVLNPAKINKSLTFFARIRLDKQDEETLQKFADEILKLPQVLECYFMLGDYDAMIRVVAESIEDYRRFQSEYLSRIKGVQNLKTDVPSQTVKQTSVMPL